MHVKRESLTNCVQAIDAYKKNQGKAYKNNDELLTGRYGRGKEGGRTKRREGKQRRLKERDSKESELRYMS